jgi:hypothetical protein
MRGAIGLCWSSAIVEEFPVPELVARTPLESSERMSAWKELIRKEDWWAIWIGVGLIVVAAVSSRTAAASSGWPSRRRNGVACPTLAQLSQHATALRGAFRTVVQPVRTRACRARHSPVDDSCRRSPSIFLISWCLYFLGLWDQAAHYNLEPPLVALGSGC